MRRFFNRTARFAQLSNFWLRQLYIDQYSFIHINKCGGTSVEKFLGITQVHDTAEQRIQRVGLERWNQRFTFALIRNPFSKVVSQYNFRVKTNQTKMKEIPIDINEWVKRAYGDKDPLYYNNKLMFSPCCDWLTFDQKIVVKKIIKLEELDSNWEQLCSDLGIPFTTAPVKNKTQMTSRNAALKVLDSESIAIIEEHFRKDFDTFGYGYSRQDL